MKRRILRRVEVPHVFLWCLMNGLIFSLFTSGLAGAADLPVVSDENLYSSSGLGSAGPPPDFSEGGVRGRITELETGENVARMHVFAKQTSSFVVKLFDISSGEIRGEAKLKMANTKTYQTITKDNGTYLLGDLPTGVYTVWAHEKNGPYLKKSYLDSQKETDKGLIYVQGGSVVDTIDISLQHGTSIGGKIARKIDGEAVGGVLVTVLDSKSKKPISSAVSDLDGNYVIQGLADGKYLVKAEKDAFVESYYGGKVKPQSGTIVTIRDGAIVPVVDFLLERSASVTGKIHDSEMKALASIRVSIFEYDGQTLPAKPVKYVTTDKKGTYTITKLRPGTYALKAEASAKYLPVVFSNEEASSGPTALVLSDGQNIGGIDFTMVPGGVIKGKVLDDATGGPVKKAWIEIFDNLTGTRVRKVSTDKNGRYDIDRLVSGSYTIQAGSKNYSPKYYDNVLDHEAATVVQLSSGSLLENIDFNLVENAVVAYSGAISGKITWAYDQSVLQRGCVQAFTLSSKKMAGSSCSDSDGSYKITKLPDGDYRLFIRGFSGFISEFYKDISFKNPNDATIVSILNGAHIEDIDFALTKTGGVAGTIFRDSDMKGLGNYEIKAVPGSYLVKVTSAGSGYLKTQEAGGERAVTIYDGQINQAVDFVFSVDASLL